jgi:hypothetical protein
MYCVPCLRGQCDHESHGSNVVTSNYIVNGFSMCMDCATSYAVLTRIPLMPS